MEQTDLSGSYIRAKMLATLPQYIQFLNGHNSHKKWKFCVIGDDTIYTYLVSITHQRDQSRFATNSSAIDLDACQLAYIANTTEARHLLLEPKTNDPIYISNYERFIDEGGFNRINRKLWTHSNLS